MDFIEDGNLTLEFGQGCEVRATLGADGGGIHNHKAVAAVRPEPM